MIRAKQESRKMEVVMPMLAMMQAAHLPLVNDQSKEEIRESLNSLVKRTLKNMI